MDWLGRKLGFGAVRRKDIVIPGGVHHQCPTAGAVVLPSNASEIGRFAQKVPRRVLFATAARVAESTRFPTPDGEFSLPIGRFGQLRVAQNCFLSAIFSDTRKRLDSAANADCQPLVCLGMDWRVPHTVTLSHGQKFTGTLVRVYEQSTFSNLSLNTSQHWKTAISKILNKRV
ncbi:hypothetical protein BLNAU_9953 [Blattamonas nauphoetae]|uniref:Uncharacterized protein n=1 Tax=Blattamonas nauphoetae TaxID=2049346 RepID=A0ABQ9XU66_9EUKA|nr:hypothetical protein BLNAU_9953 [Blattamonas nauphoetae]